MMRFFRIFLLHIQHTFEQRSYMLVYFLMSLITPFLLILFWKGATNGSKQIIPGWDFKTIASYYFYLTLVSGLLMAHVENPVAKRHIKQGDLVSFLLKPTPYLLQVFYMEFSWRVVRIFFGIGTFILFYFIWQSSIMPLHNSLIEWFLIMVILFMGFCISFILKMILGISAFWLIDTTGLFEFMDVVLYIFTGTLLPLAFLPSIIGTIAVFSPFSYIIYFPVLSVEGRFQIQGLLQVFLLQSMWFIILYCIYSLIWKQGIKKFTSVGQ